MIKVLNKTTAQKRNAFSWSMLFFALVALLASLPLIGVVLNAFGDANDLWPHLLKFVLPQAASTTLWLLVGVGILVFIFGTSTAWLVSRFEFPFKRVFEWGLVLPLAIPTYISAYVYVEFLDYTGPVQETLRSFFGFQSIKDYYFPDIRSTNGAVFLLALVLYPYVYLPARLSFQMQSSNILDVGRVLGANSLQLFLRIAIPAARPAIAIGVILVLMETLNDIGAVEYLGVRTLTLSIYDTWLNRSSLAGAAQISISLLLIVILFVYLEKRLRKDKSYQDTKSGAVSTPSIKLHGWKAFASSMWCFLPILFGFLIPFLQIVILSMQQFDILFTEEFASAAGNSILVALLTAVSCISAAFLIAYLSRVRSGLIISLLKTLSSFGYAVPGTILALGMLSIVSPFDNFIARFFDDNFGIKTGLIFSGSMLILIYAYSVRFLTIAIGSIEAGYLKISKNLNDASRTLGRSELLTVIQVDLPLLKRAFLVAGLLVCVDAIKELPATLLLRPFNFSTLATLVYEYASRAVFEEVAIAALAIVIVGLIPVYLLTRVSFRNTDSLNK